MGGVWCWSAELDTVEPKFSQFHGHSWVIWRSKSLSHGGKNIEGKLSSRTVILWSLWTSDEPLWGDVYGAGHVYYIEDSAV